MDRRGLVALGGALVVGAAGSRFLAAQRPATVEWSGASGSGRVDQPVSLARPSTLVPPKPVIEHFFEFAAATRSQMVADAVHPWAEGLEPAQQSFVQGINNRMAANGNFTKFDRANVFTNEGTFFYPVESVDNFNICVPIYGTTAEGKPAVTLVEGPIVLGLTFAAKEWPAGAGVSAAAALIPTLAVKNTGVSFDRPMREPLVARTTAGTLEANYAPTTVATKTGKVSLVARRDGADVLFAKEYEVHWA